MSDTIRTLNLYNDIIGIQMTKLRTKKKISVTIKTQVKINTNEQF